MTFDRLAPLGNRLRDQEVFLHEWLASKSRMNARAYDAFRLCRADFTYLLVAALICSMALCDCTMPVTFRAPCRSKSRFCEPELACRKAKCRMRSAARKAPKISAAPPRENGRTVGLVSRQYPVRMQ